MTKAQMLQAMCQQTGLDKHTVKELMKNGWVYLESNDVQMFSHKMKRGK